MVSAFPLPLGSEEMVLHRFRAAEPDPKLENVLYLAAGTALTQAGLSSSRTGDGADYILLTGYAFADTGIEVTYALFSSDADHRPLAHVRVDLGIEHTLDTRISDGIRQVLRLAGIEAVSSPDAKIEGLLPEPPHDTPDLPIVLAPPSAAPGGKDNPYTAGAAEGMISSPETMNPQGQRLPGEENQESQTDRGDPELRFDMSISSAGVVLFGAITEYFHYGAGGSLTAGFTRAAKSCSFTVGTRLSFSRVFNDRDVVGGQLYVSTAGLNLQVGSGMNTAYLAAAGISGGAAMISVDEPAGTMTKTVPYADLGFQTGIPVLKRLFLGCELRLLMIFDDALLILGASPAISLNREF